MARKMPRRLVALSSSAIAAIYFAGFVATRAADAGMASGAATSTPQSTSSSSTPTPTTAAGAPTAVVSASAPATATATSGATSTYRDGTYTGSGTSRRGGVSVSITVSSGRITNVTITSVNTQYPVSRIASLPAQVVSRQSGQVDNVSGATYSAQAFRQAVQVALSLAAA